MTDHNNNSSSYENINPESKTQLEETGFTQINNNVINHIKDSDAFLVWCYLYSKTTNWKTIKSNIKNVYGFGDAKLKKIFSYLRRCNLIDYVQVKGNNGKFGNVTIRILNGSKFDKNEPYCTSPPVGHKSTPTVNHTNANDELLNKDITKERKELNKPPISPTGGSVRFEDFWNIYPVKEAKKACIKKWERLGLDKMADEIIAKVDLQLLNDRKWISGFAPNPLTYIIQERWNDELDTRARGTNSRQQSTDSFHNTMAKYKKAPTDGYYDEQGNFTTNYL